jgi:hypothetical protein
MCTISTTYFNIKLSEFYSFIVFIGLVRSSKWTDSIIVNMINHFIYIMESKYVLKVKPKYLVSVTIYLRWD